MATATALVPAAPGNTPVDDVGAAVALPAPEAPVRLPDDDGMAENGPASVTPPVVVGRSMAGVAPAAAGEVGDLPSAALSAYQRAATIIDAADASCNLDWTVLGAIGQVESAHGTYGGSRLDDDGRATPPIYGIPLTGSKGTRRITDTDGGRLDGDKRFDRAVGPMQFIPSTWQMVGVDADGDGSRDPQDIDDAALAAGVYLCAGPGDLGNSGGLRAALLRYNHSAEYVDLVISIATELANGGDVVLPTAGWSGGPAPVVPTRTLAAGLPDRRPTPRMTEPRDDDRSSPTREPRPSPPASTPSENPNGQEPPVDEPSEEPSETPTPDPAKPSEEPSPTDPSPTEPSPTEPSPTEPSPTDPSPTAPSLPELSGEPTGTPTAEPTSTPTSEPTSAPEPSPEPSPTGTADEPAREETTEQDVEDTATDPAAEETTSQP